MHTYITYIHINICVYIRIYIYIYIYIYNTSSLSSLLNVTSSLLTNLSYPELLLTNLSYLVFVESLEHNLLIESRQFCPFRPEVQHWDTLRFFVDVFSDFFYFFLKKIDILRNKPFGPKLLSYI